ncbi:MAG: peptide deformylase [Candidatus Paceibacteria bacterium]
MTNKFRIIIGDKKILRQRIPEIEKPTPEIRMLVKKMRKIMKQADGIGLAANQIGLPLRLFVAEVNNKFYAVLNPKITKLSKEKEIMEEGCLSFPAYFGPVSRAKKIILEGMDAYGKKIKISATGLLARVFQHEVDHLNGILFIDKARELYHYTPKQEIK